MTANMAESAPSKTSQEPAADALLCPPENGIASDHKSTQQQLSTKENKIQKFERQLTVRRAQEQLSRKSTMPPRSAFLGLDNSTTAVPPPSPSFLPSQIFEEGGGLFDRTGASDGYLGFTGLSTKEIKSPGERKTLPARRLPSILVSGDSHLAPTNRGTLSAKRKPAFLSTSLAGAAKGTGRTVQKKVSTVEINSALDADSQGVDKSKSKKGAKKNSESAVSELLDADNQKLVMGLFGKKTRAISAHDFPSTLRSYSSPPSSSSSSPLTSNAAADEETWLLASAALAAAASTNGLVGTIGGFFTANAKGYCSPKFWGAPAAIQALIAAASNGGEPVQSSAGMRPSHAGLAREGVGGKQQRSYSDQVHGTPQQFPGAKSARSKSHEIRRVSNREGHSPPTSNSGDSSGRDGGSIGPNILKQFADFEVKGIGIFKRPAEDNGPLSGFTLGPMMWNPQESYDTGQFCTADLMFDDFGIRKWLNSIRDPNDQDDLTAAIDELSRLGSPSAAAAAAVAAHVIHINQQQSSNLTAAQHQQSLAAAATPSVTATRCEITLRGDGPSNNSGSRSGSRADINQDQDDTAVMTSAAAAMANNKAKSSLAPGLGPQQKKKVKKKASKAGKERSSSLLKPPLLDEHAFEDVPRMTLVDVPKIPSVDADDEDIREDVLILKKDGQSSSNQNEHLDPALLSDVVKDTSQATATDADAEGDELEEVPGKLQETDQNDSIVSNEAGAADGVERRPSSSTLAADVEEGDDNLKGTGNDASKTDKLNSGEEQSVSQAATAETEGADTEKTI